MRCGVSELGTARIGQHSSLSLQVRPHSKVPRQLLVAGWALVDPISLTAAGLVGTSAGLKTRLRHSNRGCGQSVHEIESESEWQNNGQTVNGTI
jgi:hypothetical protein